MKQSRRKLLGILLTASIITATVFPMQGTAAEGTDREVKSEAQKDEGMETQGALPGTGIKTPGEGETSKGLPENPNAAGELLNTVSGNILLSDDSLIMPADYDINQPVIEGFEFEENGQTLDQNGTLHFKMQAYDADGDIAKAIVEISRESGYSNTETIILKHSEGKMYTGTLSCSRIIDYEGKYYISKIRLVDSRNNYAEKAITENGQRLYTFTIKKSGKVSVTDFQIQKNASGSDGKLRVGDTVTYTAHVEFEGMNPTSDINMYLYAIKNSSQASKSVRMTYDAATKTLAGTYEIANDTYPSEWNLSYIRIYVQNGYQYFYPNQIEPDKDLKFTVINDGYDEDKPVIKSITIDKNEQMVKAGDTVTIKVKVDEKNPSSSMRVYFYPKDSGASGIYAYLYLNKNTMEYTGSINISQNTRPAKWELTSLSLSDTNGNSTSLSDFRPDWDTTRPWYFNVDPEGYLNDTEAPVIESITIDKNGQLVYPGDNITITVKVKEENPDTMAYAYFYPQVSNVSSYQIVSLVYYADTEEYKGFIRITDDTYPCEWMLTDLVIGDLKGNRTHLSDFKPGWQSTSPWYYKVETDKTYREDVEDIVVSLYGLVPQADGSFLYGYLMDNETLENAQRRGSLKDLKIWPPLPAEGVNMTCRLGSSGQEIDGDTELFFRDASRSSYNFTLSYDKACVNVVLTYVSKDDGIKMVMMPQFVDREATYGDLLDSLAMPEDADEGLFTGLELDGPVDAAAKVQDTGYAMIEAKYSDCLVSWHTRYLDENGEEASKTVSRAYKKGTTINDALASLEGPEGMGGLEFEKWYLPGIDGEEELDHELVNLNVIAVYKGKTTADVSYAYREGSGRLVSEKRLMLLDGDSLSFTGAITEAGEALEGINHFEGLVLSAWKNLGGGTDSLRYKKLNIQAQYANCVAILKYPENAYEYVVVGKGSSFTLPVENEKYMDIVWQGYGMGATITINEDKEFLVSELKFKEDTPEIPPEELPGEPSDDKLTEEEIDQIIKDIEQSEGGDTIHVDMKKDTIVPKEVLESIQGKEVNIVLNMGGYSWSISGNEVVADGLKDIDLEVIVDTDGIPPAIIDSLAEGNPTTQITLVHEGEFGFRADLTVNLGSENSGSTGKLYYYDSSGKLIYMDAGEVGADGNISLSFSHASEYVVIFERAPVEDEGENDNGNNNETDDEADKETGNEADKGINNGTGNENTSHSNDRNSSTQGTVSVAKAGDNGALTAAVEQNNDSVKPKSPKTGE